MNLNTSQNLGVREWRTLVRASAGRLTELYASGPDAFGNSPSRYDAAVRRAENDLDDTILGYVKARTFRTIMGRR